MDTNDISLRFHMDREKIIRFQVIMYCHVLQLFPGKAPKNVTAADIECMTLLGLNGKMLILDCCNILVQHGIFSSIQSVRNSLLKMYDMNILGKEEENRKEKGKRGRGRKMVYLNPAIRIATEEGSLVQLLLSTDVNRLQDAPTKD